MTDDQDCWLWLDPHEEGERAEFIFGALMVERGRTRRREIALRGKAITHLDGNPLNNDPSNLRIVDIKANR